MASASAASAHCTAPCIGGEVQPAQMVVPAVLDCVVGATGKAPRDLNPAVSELSRPVLEAQRNDAAMRCRKNEGVTIIMIPCREDKLMVRTAWDSGK